jgi:hypothetical protein
MDLPAAPGEFIGAASADRPAAASGAGEPEPGAGAFVWSILGLMIVCDLAFVLKYAAHVPAFDDYAMIPSYVGEQPLTIGWLWSQDNEHRVFLPRLIHLATYRLSGGDFRASMFVSLACLGFEAARGEGARRPHPRSRVARRRPHPALLQGL